MSKMSSSCEPTLGMCVHEKMMLGTVVLTALDESKPEFIIARSILRDGQTDDSRFAQSLRYISERHLQLQTKAIAKVIAFRDSLSPVQRLDLARLSAEPKFALVCSG